MHPFLTSKEFLIGLAAAGIIIIGSIGLASAIRFDGEWFDAHGCDALEPVGDEVIGERSTSMHQKSGETRRDRTFELPLNATDVPGRVVACTIHGSIRVVAGDADVLRVAERVFIDDSSDRLEREVRDADVDVRFVRSGDTVHLVMDHGELPAERGWFDTHSASVTFTITLPRDWNATHALSAGVGSVRFEHPVAVAAELESSVGDVVVKSATIEGRLEASTDVGSVTATDLETRGDVRMSADVGSVRASWTNLVSSNVTVSADVGDVTLTFPSGAPYGYDVVARANVGDADVSIGATEHSSADHGGASSRVEARTEDYDLRAAQVRVRATADVGDVEVRAV